MSHRAPTRADHDLFCRNEGWEKVRDARGRAATHHVTYRLVLPDGSVLRTRISHPPNRTAYGPGMWRHVLRDQLQVSEAEFWACVLDAAPPRRPVRHVTPAALPPELARLLIDRVGLAEREVRSLDREQAIERINRYWAEGP